MRAAIKLLIEAGPLVVFFVANARQGLIWATGAFMVAIAASVAASYVLQRRLPTLPLVTAVFVMVFGGLTLYLQDATFIKLKPTIVNALFAAILFAGLAFRKSYLKSVIGEMIPMTDEGWRKLTFRWAFYFVLLAGLNEVVWRNFSDDAWVNFKVFGLMPLTLLFSVSQLPLMTRHRLDEEAAGQAD